MKVIDYKETMKCLEEVEDCEDKTYAKSLLEWAINKRTFEAVPLSVIEKIHNAIDNAEPDTYIENPLFYSYALTKEHVNEIIDKAVKEIEHG